MRPSNNTSQQSQRNRDRRDAEPGTDRAAERTPARLVPASVRSAARSLRTWLENKVPDRFHKIGHELAKFGIIGIINIGVNFAVVNILWYTVLAGSEVKAKAIATVVAATSAYFMNRHWTYRDRPKSSLRREYALFFAFNLVGLVIEVAVLSIAKYGLHQTNLLVLNIFTGLGIVIGTVFRFWAYRTHVFKETVAEDLVRAADAGSRLSRLIRPRPITRTTRGKPPAKAAGRTAHTKPSSNTTPPAKSTRAAAQPARTKS